MDVLVSSSPAGSEWALADLLGRPMGRISTASDGTLTVHPEGEASKTMAGMRTGPFPTLDAALAEIERHTRGTCRRVFGQDRG